MLAIALATWTGAKRRSTGLGLLELQRQPGCIGLIFSVLDLDLQTPEQGPVIPTVSLVICAS